jgi:DNA polymerase V
MSERNIHSSLEFYTIDNQTCAAIPLVNTAVMAGFPSPAGDFMDMSIDLNKELVRHPYSTFYARVKGNSMQGAGIDDGDLLVIDKSLEPADGKVAVCFIDGEFTVKRIQRDTDCCWLVAENDAFKPIRVTADNDFVIWGIVVHVIKTL